VIEEEYTFSGYYTFHFEVNGEMQMLSVNGYSGAVWFHSWHGNTSAKCSQRPIKPHPFLFLSNF